MSGAIRVNVASVEASAALQVDSTTQGVLFPRMTEAQRDAISSPATGLVVYNTDTDTYDVYNGAAWVILGTGATPGAHTHAAADVTSGQLALERGGTESDLSATGPGHLVQASAGAALTVRLDNLAGTTAPTAGDDTGDGYSVGSRWYDTTNDKEYVCLDATAAAAVWKETTVSGGVTDADAIHDNVAGEIAALTEVTPASGDWVLIEDVSDSNNKKKVQAGNLGGGGGGGRTLIDEQILGVDTTTITFASIPGSYRNLVLHITARGAAAPAAVEVRAQFNNDTGNNYDTQRHAVVNTASSGAQYIANASAMIGFIAAGNTAAGEVGVRMIVIPQYANTTWRKQFYADGGYRNTVDASGGKVLEHTQGSWRNTAAITEIDLFLSSGDFEDGSIFTLWGES